MSSSNRSRVARARRAGYFMLATAAIPGMAFAQQAPSASGADGATPPATANGAAPRQEGVQLQDIVVTARRTNENLQRVPVAITALTGAAIRDQNIVAPQDLMSKVPSLSVTSASDNRDSLRLTIRGQGQQEQGGQPSVVAYFAEVPAQLAGPGSLFDLQNLQILKGPQGTLFGRNTTGGALLVEPQRPTNKFGGYAEITGGSDHEWRGQGAINVPIIDDKLAIRFATDINRRQGFTHDVINGTDLDDIHYESYRLGIMAKPTEWLENYLVLDAFQSDTNGPGTKLFNLDPKGLAATAFPSILAFYNLHLPYSETTVYTGGHPYDHVRNRGLADIATIHLNDKIYIKNVLGLREFKQRYTADVLGVPVPLIAYVPSPYDTSGTGGPASERTLSEEIQIGGTSIADKLKWIVGLYGENDKPTSPQNKDAIDQFGAGPYVYQSLNHDKTRAIYGQGTYDLSDLVLDGLKFTAGVRHTWDTRKQIARNYLADPNNLDDVVVCQQPNSDATCAAYSSAKFQATTGTVGLDYQVSPRTLLYIASRRGYKSGGFNSVAPVPAFNSYQPEYVTDVEIGAKTDFSVGGAKVRINADVFRQYYDKIQETFSVLFNNNQSVSLTRNTGSAILQGAEIEYTIIPTPRLEFSGFYNYLDAYYTKNIINGVNLDDIAFPQAPKNKFSFTGRYDFTPTGSSIGTISAGATYSYQSHIEFQVPLLPVDPNPGHGQSGYGLLDLRVNWDNVMGKPFDASFFMTNATDKRYKLSGTLVYASLGIDGGLVGEPREFGFRLRYRFGS